MALEKWLLSYAKIASKEDLEKWCLYLIKNSNSASITAIVVSIVLAQPIKLFSIAKILFQTKEFFFYDTSRMFLDKNAKFNFSIGYGWNYDDKIYQDERIETCNDAHRSIALEHLAVNYQFLRYKEDKTNEEIENRQKDLWKIFDYHYSELPDEKKQTENDKVWRLYLARMDRRKMNPEFEQQGENVVVRFNPELAPELQKISEESSQQLNKSLEYMPLKWWAEYRFRKDENKYKEYQKYENDFRATISESKEILDKLKNKPDEYFSLSYSYTSIFVCAVLLRDFFDCLSKEEKEFCKNIILNFAYKDLRSKDYPYEMSMGAEPAINSLPILIKNFPEQGNEIKTFLFLLLFEDYRRNASKFVVQAIFNNMWKQNFDDAQSVFLGYLLLKPKYVELKNKMRKEHHKKFAFSDISDEEVFNRFLEENENQLERVISNDILFNELKNIELLDLDILITAFNLLPIDTRNKEHKKFVEIIFPVFAAKLSKRKDKVEIHIKQKFLKKFAYFILHSTKEEIETYLKPFTENFDNPDVLADLFQELIFAEDTLNKYEEFWNVWEIFYDKIVEICNESNSYHFVNKTIHNYLLADNYWNEGVEEWHSLKEREKIFFKKVAQDIGHHPSVLYSLAKLLNKIASKFLEDGIFWISSILKKNQNLLSEGLEQDTVFYLENIIRKYILTNRSKIRKNTHIKQQIIVILNFLVEKGSVTGYLLRENLL